MKTDFLLGCLFLCSLGLLILQGMKINELETRVAYAESKCFSLSVDMQETEEKCLRMTDTCIDIIANRRWENGN